MPEIFPSYEISYNELEHGFLKEAEGLSFIFQSPLYTKLLQRYDDYKAYLEDTKEFRDAKKYIKKVKSSGGVICATDKSPVLFEALCSAHFAALCELFNNGHLNESILDLSNLSYIIKQQLSLDKENPQALKQRADALDQLDGVRTIQLLRALALVTIDTSNIKQVSIGAGAATKDIAAIHKLPKIIQRQDENTKASSLHFSMSMQATKSVVVSDIDPQRKTFYEGLENSSIYDNAIGLNIDTYDALDYLPELDKEKLIGERNFFVALRIDHRMLPDVPKFFQLIHKCMDQSADLVITMGSGFNIEEFQGRVDKIQEIFEFLDNLKLNPVLIKLHDQGDIVTQRNTNKFSLASITTYQILHCKLKKNILSKI